MSQNRETTAVTQRRQPKRSKLALAALAALAVAGTERALYAMDCGYQCYGCTITATNCSWCHAEGCTLYYDACESITWNCN
jgi:hypothetical protein